MSRSPCSTTAFNPCLRYWREETSSDPGQQIHLALKLNHTMLGSVTMNSSQTTSSGSRPEIARSSSHFSAASNRQPRESPPHPKTSKSKDGHLAKRGRKGHTKSRKGCFNCKRARVKVPQCNARKKSQAYIRQ